MVRRNLIGAALLALFAGCTTIEAGGIGGSGPCVRAVLLDVNKNGPNISVGGAQATAPSDANCPKLKSICAKVFDDTNGNDVPDPGEHVGVSKCASLAVPGFKVQTGAISFNQNDEQNGGSHYYIEVTDEEGGISTFGGTI